MNHIDYIILMGIVIYLIAFFFNPSNRNKKETLEIAAAMILFIVLNYYFTHQAFYWLSFSFEIKKFIYHKQDITKYI